VLFAAGIFFGTVVGTLKYVDTSLDSRISQAVDTKVGSTLNDYEKRTRAVETENEISRKATECYSAMVDAKCNFDYGAAIAAYEDFIRHYSIDTVPETLRNILFQQLLAAWMIVAQFESIRIQEVDRIALSFDHAPRRACASAYNNLGACYLCHNQLDKARVYFLQALSILKSAPGRNDEEIETAVVGLLLASLSDSKLDKVKERVDSSIQTLDVCETIVPVSYASIHAKLEIYSGSKFLTYLRITNPAGFSDSFSELLREIPRKDSVKEVTEKGVHFLRGAVKINGKEVLINYQLSPLDFPATGDRPRDMKKEDLERLKPGC
jgi:tetratricopeptide (TPR) repeat protein